MNVIDPTGLFGWSSLKHIAHGVAEVAAVATVALVAAAIVVGTPESELATAGVAVTAESLGAAATVTGIAMTVGDAVADAAACENGDADCSSGQGGVAADTVGAAVAVVPNPVSTTIGLVSDLPDAAQGCANAAGRAPAAAQAAGRAFGSGAEDAGGWVASLFQPGHPHGSDHDGQPAPTSSGWGQMDGPNIAG